MNTERTPEVTSLEIVNQRSGYQSIQPVTRPPWWGVDLELNRRPGVVTARSAPRPFPNARIPITRQEGEPAAPMHGRPNKTLTPVFGTAQPLHGLAGEVRRFAATYPDHEPNYWLLKLASDRVELWERRVRKLLPLAVPMVALGWLVQRRTLRERVELQGEEVVFYS